MLWLKVWHAQSNRQTLSLLINHEFGTLAKFRRVSFPPYAMVLRCAIHLDSEQTSYTSGGVASGFILLSTTWSDKVYGISVKLASKVEVDWDSSRLFNPYRTSRNEDVSFHSDCQILLNRTEGEQSCLANLVSKRTILITRGVVHRYPFLLKLPKDLPSSYHGSYGHISYKLVVFIRKPFREMYVGATKSVRISPSLDLNEQSVHLQLPVADERKYFFSRARSASFRNSRSSPAPPICGPSSRSTSTSPAPVGTQNLVENEVICLRVRLPKTAFVPEEVVQFEVDVDNRSHLSLAGVSVLLNSNTYFQIDQSCKIDGRTILRVQGPGVGPHGRELFSHSFPCPHVLPTGLGSGLVGAIDLQYFIQFELRISDQVQLSSVVKLVIGTVPFLQRNLAPGLASYLLELEEGLGSEELLTLDDMISPRPRPHRSTSVSSLPPSYDCFQLKSSRLVTEDVAETPPPTYEEALSSSLSLLRAHNHKKGKSKSKSKHSSNPTPSSSTMATNSTTNIAEYEGDCCTCLSLPH